MNKTLSSLLKTQPQLLKSLSKSHGKTIFVNNIFLKLWHLIEKKIILFLFTLDFYQFIYSVAVIVVGIGIGG